MPTPAPPGHQPMADRPAPRIPLARLVWSRWVVNPLVLSLVALPLTLPGQVRRVVRLRCTTTGVRAFRDVHRSVISVPRRMRPPSSTNRSRACNLRLAPIALHVPVSPLVTPFLCSTYWTSSPTTMWMDGDHRSIEPVGARPRSQLTRPQSVWRPMSSTMGRRGSCICRSALRHRGAKLQPPDS
jgi:hypothetical protein